MPQTMHHSLLGFESKAQPQDAGEQQSPLNGLPLIHAVTAMLPTEVYLLLPGKKAICRPLKSILYPPPQHPHQPRLRGIPDQVLPALALIRPSPLSPGSRLRLLTTASKMPASTAASQLSIHISPLPTRAKPETTMSICCRSQPQLLPLRSLASQAH